MNTDNPLHTQVEGVEIVIVEDVVGPRVCPEIGVQTPTHTPTE